MVTIRSPGSISCDIAFRVVVLPEPVPPEITMLSRQAAAIFKSRARASEMLPWRAMESSVIVFFANLRIEIEQPSMASGGAMTLTRLPSSNRASHTGDVSSTRRPIRVTIRCATFITC